MTTVGLLIAWLSIALNGSVLFANECLSPVPLGMEDGTIEDWQITSSGYYNLDPNYKSRQGRLNNENYWASKLVEPSEPYIQVDFNSTEYEVTGIRTQGSGKQTNDTWWVTHLHIQFGDTEDSLVNYVDELNDPKNFTANHDRDEIVNITFPMPIQTRYLRIIPTAWETRIALRFEVMGCYNGGKFEEEEEGENLFINCDKNQNIQVTNAMYRVLIADNACQSNATNNKCNEAFQIGLHVDVCGGSSSTDDDCQVPPSDCSTDSIDIVQELCNGKPSCTMPVNDDFFGGDPCIGPYALGVRYTCDSNQKTGRACQNGTLTLKCKLGEVSVQSVYYTSGQCNLKNQTSALVFDRFCLDDNDRIEDETVEILRHGCKGQTNCIIPVNNGTLGHPCKTNFKSRLEVHFLCKDECLNGGKNKVDGSCKCIVGWSGTRCENREDVKEPSPTCETVSSYVSPGDDTVPLSWKEPLFTDDLDPEPTIKCDPSNDSNFKIGLTNVMCNATDESGNSNTCTFQVKVFEAICEEDAEWPETKAGTSAESTERCPFNTAGRNMATFLRKCTFYNSTVGGVWDDDRITNNCGDEESASLDDFFNITLTDDNVDDVAATLSNVIEDSIQKNEDIDIADIQQAFTNIVEYGSSSPDVTEGVVNSVNTILSTDISSDDQESAMASSQILKSVEQQVAYTIDEHGKFRSVKPNVVVEGVSVSQAVFTSGIGFGVSQTDGGIGAGVTYDPDKMQSERPNVGSAIELPNDALFENGTGNGAMVSFIAYSNDRLFKSRLLDELNDTRVVGPILSAVVLAKNVTNLKKPVVIHIKPVEDDAKSVGVFNNTKCVYWDFNKRDGIGDWAEDGCQLISAESGKITCHCDHLTNFAVLVYHGKKIINSKALDIVSKIGCYISLVALIVTVITLILVRRLKMRNARNNRGMTAENNRGHNVLYLMIQLCISLIAVYVVFLAAIDRTVPVSGCTVAAAFLHYFVLATMTSTAVQARYMYTKLVTPLKNPVGREPNLIVKATAVTYGFPAIIVAVSLGVDHRGTGFKSYNNEHYCFPKIGCIVYFAVLLPIAIVLIHNLLSAGLIISKVICRPRFHDPRARGNDYDKFELKKRLRNSTAISCLLGLSWIFGFFAIEEATLAFQWLFTILNSLQGLLIFIFFCLMSRDVRATIISSTLCSSCRNYINTTSSWTETSNISRSKTAGKDDDKVSIDSIEMSKQQSSS